MKKNITTSRLFAARAGVALVALALLIPTHATPHFINAPTPQTAPKAAPKIYRLTPAPLPTPPQPRPAQRSTPIAPAPTAAAPKATPTRPTRAIAPTNNALLGTQEFYMGNISALPKWTRVLNQIARDKPTVDACDQGNCTTPQLKQWRNFVKSQQGKPLLTQLENLNRYANKFPYITDSRLWKKSDYWAAPLEFLKHSGDCEDYVILKYTTLRQLGVPAANIRLVVVQDTVRNLAHAILAVYDGNEIYILDSLFDAVLSHKQLLQYIPYYSVNENSRWAHIKSLK